jgi:hypothetical protein
MSDRTVFLSYRHEDVHLVEPLKQAIETADLSVIDFQNLGPGGIEKAITDAAIFVGCISAGGYADDELRCAISKLEALERDRSWLVMVPITTKLTQSDFAADVDKIKRRPAAEEIGGKFKSKTKVGIAQAKNATVTGAVMDASSGGDVSTELEVETLTIDHNLVLTGTIKRTGNAS